MHSAYDSHAVKRNARKVCASRRIHADVCQLLANCWGSDDNSRWMFLLRNFVSSTRCMGGTKRAFLLIALWEKVRGKKLSGDVRNYTFPKYVCSKFWYTRAWLKFPVQNFKPRTMDYMYKTYNTQILQTDYSRCNSGFQLAFQTNGKANLNSISTITLS